jgi:2-dehydro-3-deoxyphosphogluconate aldolase/(4S)-4-hydroxy-2-oxoglutarate aldolase
LLYNQQLQKVPVIEAIKEHKLVAIIRGAASDDVLKIADALYDGGIRLLEITFNSPNAMGSLARLAAAMKDRMHIGMGTVLDAATARQAIDTGAAFIISPIVDIDTIRATKEKGAVSIPGAFTPTEIVYAYKHGADIVKVFPASAGAGFIKDVRAPLPHIPLMPTGGVNLENIPSYFRAGAVAVGLGSALVDTNKPVNDTYLQELVVKARAFVHAVNNLQ